jgi:thiol-disulfide isomerase/thioredoxin
MKISKQIILFWFILFVPFLAYKIYSRFKQNEVYKQVYSGIKRGYVGSKFRIDNFKDTSGNISKIDTKKTNITIVDFWFKECPPCLADMKTFSPLLNKLESKVSVVSISVNNYSLWKSLFNSNDERFEMFHHIPQNWKHLVLNSSESLALNNEVPSDNIQLIQNTFQTTNFPMYFVLDSSNTIIASPFSLTEYLTVDLLKKQNRFTYYLSQKETWSADKWFIPLAFVEFSGFYWIVINGFFLISLLLKRKK